MNIKEAKGQIKNAIVAYMAKDEFGNYRIPIEKQRPVFLLGAPGIGKTAIIEQIAGELGIGLVAYSMTHHTRQSALGLPFITSRSFGGKTYEVSEYTMSEILASVYDVIEATGLKEGILFLDESNCISETLAPAMLQFLQYKVFGRHRVPEGWIVVTAGNPPEYNNSVHEYDIVTLDRLKLIEVEPDYEVWKEYAYAKSVHGAIITYLDIKKTDFYIVETTVEGKRFVTARGWEDLSEVIKIYEEKNIPVDRRLIVQYLQQDKVAKEFSVYYDLYNKYKSDYQIDEILNAKVGDSIKNRAKSARFDERIMLLGMLIERSSAEMRDVLLDESCLVELLRALKVMKTEFAKEGVDCLSVLSRLADEQTALIKAKEKAGNLSAAEKRALQKLVETLGCYQAMLMEQAGSGVNAFGLIKDEFDKSVQLMKRQAQRTGGRLDNLFRFAQEVFGEGQELLILVTEFTINRFSSQFIAKYGSAEYFKHNKELLFYERQKEIIRELDILEL